MNETVSGRAEHDTPGESSAVNDVGTEQLRPAGTWRVEHPKLSLAASIVAFVIGPVFLLRGLFALGSGTNMSSRLAVYLLFWLLVTTVNAIGLLRAIRVVKDPEAERARIEQRFARVMGQPRKTLLRKAAITLGGLTSVLVVTGVLLLAATDKTVSHIFGVVLIALGVVLAALGSWRLRHPRI